MIWMEVDFTRQTIPTNTNTPNLSKIMATYMSHKMVVAIYIYYIYIYSAEILLTGSWPLWTVGQARGILTKKMEQYIVEKYLPMYHYVPLFQ